MAFLGPEIIAEVTETMLRHGYADEDVRMIRGGNWMSLCARVWK